MINFVVCDDNKIINKNLTNIIGKIMMKNRLAYKVYNFYDYDAQFQKIISAKISSKVYILDIEMPSQSGIDVARKIREKDVDSIIIFITSHEELGGAILKSELMFLTFISKFDNYEKSAESAINKALNYIDRKSIIRFSDNNALYTIPSSDILYITRDSIERKCIMKTDYAEFHLTKSLIELKNMLDDDFVQTHRACYVNVKRVRKVHSRQKEILFDNGITIDLISENYKDNVKKFEVKLNKKRVDIK